MNYQHRYHRLLPLSFLLFATLALLPKAFAEDWHRVSNKDGKISASFPTNIAANLQTQTDKTPAGKVKSNFGEYHGDGILLAASGADIPMLARAAGNKATFNGSKKTFLDEAQGTEISFSETTVQGAPAAILIYKGNAYRGKGGPYQGKALFIAVKKRMYVINSVISKSTGENQAATDKMFQSIQIAQ